eukprot:gene35830-43457_t
MPFKDQRLKAKALLSSKWFGITTALLTIVNVVLLSVIRSAEALNSKPSKHEKNALAVLAAVALAILSIFVVESLVTILAYGWKFFYGEPGWQLRVFDTIVIFTAFSLCITLQGGAGLAAPWVLVFRLWRILRLIAFTSNVAERRQQARIKELERENTSLRQQNKDLQQTINGWGDKE